MPYKNEQQRKAIWARRNRKKREEESSMKKEANSRFAAAFEDELSKLSAKPPVKAFATAAQKLSRIFGKAPVKPVKKV